MWEKRKLKNKRVCKAINEHKLTQKDSIYEEGKRIKHIPSFPWPTSMAAQRFQHLSILLTGRCTAHNLAIVTRIVRVCAPLGLCPVHSTVDWPEFTDSVTPWTPLRRRPELTGDIKAWLTSKFGACALSLTKNLIWDTFAFPFSSNFFEPLILRQLRGENHFPYVFAPASYRVSQWISSILWLFRLK